MNRKAMECIKRIHTPHSQRIAKRAIMMRDDNAIDKKKLPNGVRESERSGIQMRNIDQNGDEQ